MYDVKCSTRRLSLSRRRLTATMTTSAQPEHTERTPLLQSSPNNLRQIRTSAETPESPTSVCSPILQYLAQFKTGELPPDETWCPESFTTEGSRTAFVLLVWLHYARHLQRRTPSINDTWEEWATEVKDSSTLLDVKQRITEIWTTFLDAPRTPSEIEEVLWRPFPLEGSGHSPLTRGEGQVEFAAPSDSPGCALRQ